MNTCIAIIGAGNVGSALGEHLARAGYPVRFGVRNPDSVRNRIGARVHVATVAEAAAWAEVVFFCVAAAQAVSTAMGCGDLQGKVLVDCANPVAWNDGPVLHAPPEGSVAVVLATALPGTRIVKGFNTFGAEIHGDHDLDGVPADVYLAGDDRAAVDTVTAIAAAVGCTAVDAGPLCNAALLESLAVLRIHLATKGRHGREMAFKLLRRA